MAMTPLRALVVDDEPPALSELAWLLDSDERIGRVLTADSGAQALRVLENEQVDVVFCDISMPGLDGLDLARVLARFATRPHLVFVTAYEQHAVEAFDVQAVDYVLKPVRAQRLAEAVRRAVQAHSGPAKVSTEVDEDIAVELGGVTRFVRRSNVLFVEAAGDYARLHTATGSHLIRVPLSTLEERWASAGFVRIHRSTLINVRHVNELLMDAGRFHVRLGGHTLTVSRRHTRQVKDLLIHRDLR
ncbi:LytTR family DNA-binding domain-containing protein [Kineosporia rhizophila]|uniref:LytR/AlgR family response regulator transcription factor n=1 Tax=Kineosporia TaxID=49184 RepID=UPI001E421A22|nr:MULTISPECIES: LytTR family DNA-binding domain-containing protein [Kineosporia]MCE0540061.1 LytTR family DNA-binding domain-containing protein [Kineosporia rhizophila]GLY19205.1 DNA-binding response regulator [Kineosporia sp. NBRC 101677]